MLAVITAISIPFLTRYAEKRAAKGKWQKKDAGSEKSRRRKTNIRNLWGIEDIRNNVVRVAGKYSAVLRIGTVNFNLMSQNEQHALETILMSVATGLDFPVQFLCTTETVDTRHAVNEMHAINELSQVRQVYAQNLLNYLNGLMEQRAVLIKHTYAVVTCSEGEYDKVLGKLEHMCAQLIGGLSRAGITATPLNSEEIADILFKVMNRCKSVRPSDAVKAGAMDVCVSGKGVRSNVQVSKAG